MIFKIQFLSHLDKVLVPVLNRVKGECDSDVSHSTIGGFFRETGKSTETGASVTRVKRLMKVVWSRYVMV